MFVNTVSHNYSSKNKYIAHKLTGTGVKDVKHGLKQEILFRAAGRNTRTNTAPPPPRLSSKWNRTKTSYKAGSSQIRLCPMLAVG
jgi:hypothetical protein